MPLDPCKVCQRERSTSCCAICHENNSTVRLCASCRDDPANDGWNADTRSFNAEVEDRAGELRLVDLVEAAEARRMRPLTALQATVIRLYLEGACYPYRDRRGRLRGTRRRSRLTVRAIAKLAGCGHQYAARLITSGKVAQFIARQLAAAQAHAAQTT